MSSPHSRPASNRGVRVQFVRAVGTRGQTIGGQMRSRRLTSGVLDWHSHISPRVETAGPRRYGPDRRRPPWFRLAIIRRQPCYRWIFPGGTCSFVFTYMTSSGRLLVPFLFSFCSPEVNNNGVGNRVLPSAGWSRTREGTLALDADRADHTYGYGRAGQRALAPTALSSAALTVLLAEIGRPLVTRSRHAG